MENLELMASMDVTESEIGILDSLVTNPGITLRTSPIKSAELGAISFQKALEFRITCRHKIRFTNKSVLK